LDHAHQRIPGRQTLQRSAVVDVEPLEGERKPDEFLRTLVRGMRAAAEAVDAQGCT
jgi:hypothetical protein